MVVVEEEPGGTCSSVQANQSGILPDLGEREVRIWKDAEMKVDVNDDTANRGNGNHHHWMALRMQGHYEL